MEKKKFSKFFPMSKLAKKFFFEIFQEFQHFFVKWPKGVLENMERNKVMEYELILSICLGVMRDHLPGEVR